MKELIGKTFTYEGDLYEIIAADPLEGSRFKTAKNLGFETTLYTAKAHNGGKDAYFYRRGETGRLYTTKGHYPSDDCVNA